MNKEIYIISLATVLTIYFIIAHNANKVDRLKAEIVHMREDIKRIEYFIEEETKQAETEEKQPKKFIVTAYCPCEKCCGEWANNRPLDENGKQIVYGASGRELISGYSIAVDPSIIPLGSIVTIDGKEYRADDTGGMITGNRIDIYFDSHEQATEYGKQEKEIVWK